MRRAISSLPAFTTKHVMHIIELRSSIFKTLLPEPFAELNGRSHLYSKRSFWEKLVIGLRAVIILKIQLVLVACVIILHGLFLSGYSDMMEKDKAPGHGGLLPHSSARFISFSSSGSSFNMTPDQSSSSFSHVPTMNTSSDSTCFDQRSDSSHFSQDICQMPDSPLKNLGHRRAHSEILTLPDDLSFDSDLGVVSAEGPSFSDDTEEDLLSMYLDMDKLNPMSATSTFQVGEPSVAAVVSPTSTPTPASVAADVSSGLGERPRIRHQHSQSMDGSSTIKPEMLISASEEISPADSKKAMSAAKLAELALIDPKRAKRIWANRQSAARSKERKMRYIAELERKVLTLQTEATSLSAQLTLLQRDTNGLTAENSELKLRLQTMEQQVHLQDALNDALKEEIQHLKVLTGQMVSNGSSSMPMMNFTAGFGGGQQQYYPNSNNHHHHHAMHTIFTAQQFQQLQINTQKQQFQQHQLHQLQQQQQQQQQQIRQSQAIEFKSRASSILSPTLLTPKESPPPLNLTSAAMKD